MTKSVPCSLFPTLHPVGSRKFADSSSSLTPIVALAYASSRIWPSLSWFHRLPCVTGALSVYALSYRWSAMTVRLRRMDACVWTCWKCHPPVWSVVVAKTLANLVSYLRHTSDTTSTACGAPRDYLRRPLRSHRECPQGKNEHVAEVSSKARPPPSLPPDLTRKVSADSLDRIFLRGPPELPRPFYDHIEFLRPLRGS